MSEDAITEIGRLIVNTLVANERLEFALKHNRPDITEALYMLYSSSMMLINNVVDPNMRCCRLFRLKYHHILPSDSVDEYLSHCLSKLLSEWFTNCSNFHEFIVPVTLLHLQLTAILLDIKARHHDIVCGNEKVQRSWSSLKNDDSEGGVAPAFVPVYHLPSHPESPTLFSAHCLTLYAINKHYFGNGIDDTLKKMLLDFDHLLSDFELNFMCEVNRGSLKSQKCAEKTMDVVVMFVEAVQWAHSRGLLSYSSIADSDIEIMIGIPRLSVLYGCGVAKDGPLSEWSLFRSRDKDDVNLRLAPVFRRYYTELAMLRRQLAVLSGLEMSCLTQLLLDHDDLPRDTVISRSLNGLTINDRHQLISGDIHTLFKLISSVSDQMLSEHASDYRFFMETIYKIYKDEPENINVHLSLSTSISSLDSLQGNNVEEANDFSSFVVVDQGYLNIISTSKCLRSIRSIRPLSQRSKNKQQARHRGRQWPHVIELGIASDMPPWQRDSSHSNCCHCGTKFTLFRRRHHCRRCGYLFCYACWGTKMPLPYHGIHGLVPVCMECEQFIKGRVN